MSDATEGKLKRLILLHSMFGDKGLGSIIELTELYPILKEAKADFPEKPDSDIRPDPQTKRIWNWYIKWFGEL